MGVHTSKVTGTLIKCRGGTSWTDLQRLGVNNNIRGSAAATFVDITASTNELVTASTALATREHA